MGKSLASMAVIAVLLASMQAQQQPKSRRLPPPSSDPYAAQTKYLDYLKDSLQKGTSFAALEPNNEKLWSRVRQTAQNFLTTEWRKGKLQGAKPEQAYFVRCDRSTMTQNDLDNGRLILLVGVAPTKPSEFVTFRITQLTAAHH